MICCACLRFVPRALGLVVALLVPMPLWALSDVSLRVSGGPDELAKSLAAVSQLEQARRDGITDPREVLAAAQGDYLQMVEALYAGGYYGVSVSIRLDGREAADISATAVPAGISTAVITVNPGRQFVFGRAQIGPVRDPAVIGPEFASGQPARATVVRQTARDVVTGWRDAGHAKANIADQDIAAVHPSARLDVNIRVAPGPRLRFGTVTVEGESRVRRAAILRIAGVPSGEVYSPAAVAKSAARLRKAGAFRLATVEEAETANPDGTLDMVISVADRKRRRLNFGAEFTSNDGLTLSGFWLHRNLLGGAERLRFDFEVAQIDGTGAGLDYSISTRFEKPAIYGPDTLLYADFELAHEDEPTYSEDRARLGIGVSREISDKLTADLGLSLLYSDFKDADGQRQTLLFGIPAALTWDRRDDSLDTTRGFYLRAEVEPFREFRQKHTGGRIRLDGRSYHQVGPAVLAARVQLGALIGAPARDMPPSYLFFSGGGDTVRGQPYRSLDSDDGGTRRGGRSFAALSLEARMPVALNGKLGAVAFVDTGFVGADPGFSGNGAWHSGAGLGARYKTPVGPIRLDVGFPVSGETSDGPQLYVGIGQAF